MSLVTNKVYLPDVVGKGYGSFWNFKGRYRVVKGSRASKKSTTTAMNIIYRMMKYPGSNALVVRKTFRTLKDSCFNQLLWAIHRLKVDRYWKGTVSPLELVYLPTGQKILFRGLDDPLKITSVTVDKGYLCFLWIEEAYEIMDEASFDTLDESVRGEVPEPLFKQITLSFNPRNEHHRLKKRFFDVKDSDVLAITTNYMCNEWLSASDKKVFERMKVNNPRRYQVAGLGNWGVVDGLVYENWEERDFALSDVKIYQSFFGLDFGYTHDPTAFVVGFIDKDEKFIYIYDEFYQKHMSNEDIYKKIYEMGYSKEKIIADSAEPKSIDRLRTLGLSRIKPAKKGKDSIMNGISFIQEFKIVIHPRCVNFLTEISNYQWDSDKFGNKVNKPIDDFNHLQDALRYAMEEFQFGKGSGIKFFKGGFI